LNLPASGLKKVQLKDGLNQEKLKVLSCRTGNGLRENVLCWILLGEMFVDKLLITKHNKLKLCFSPTTSLINNPIPILWNFDGIYGWVPIEVVKNEVKQHQDKLKLKQNAGYGTISFNNLKFTWHQAHRLRPDVGKMLEELANDRV